MLEVKNLCKVYKPKKGVPVTALNSVSITFPEKGMVFLLGKSGCGKSTFLNLLGGLDSYDSGEIIISGKSSKAFRQSDFDSYRNTMVGFIFQEYNLLEEFTVGANIALALELQGKKATDETVSAILDQVDLSGYGGRRPNELSGGQKQRVAIARALVKNPQIIMADEPTGALDSATGRQVLETLKKLSREKLVILVSHDREFAEKYADRIIELSDGSVLSDQEFEWEETAFEEKGMTFGEGEILVSAGYQLTEEDREQINTYLALQVSGEGAVIRAEKRGRRRKEATKPDLSHLKPVRFIPSRLPMKAAFRIGGGALKHKKIRLAFTIILSCIAFGLFGLADTFGAYDHITTCTRSILDSDIGYAALIRTEKYVYGENEDEFYYRQGGKLRAEELQEITRETGVPLEGVFVPYGASLDFQGLYNTQAEFTKSDYHIYPYSFNGFAEIGQESLEAQTMSLLCGRLPDGKANEIAISSYICETFYIGGFAREEDGKTVYDNIQKPEDMLGKAFPLNGEDYTVVGVVSSGFDLERYRSLTEEKLVENTADMLVDYALVQELTDIRNYSLAQLAFVGEGHLAKLVEREPSFYPPENGYLNLMWVETVGKEEYHYGFVADYYGTLEDRGGYEILWIGEEKTSLAENEVVISMDVALQSLSLEGNWEGAFKESGGLDFSRLSFEEQESFLQQIRDLGDMTINTYSRLNRDTHLEIEGVRIVGILLPDESGVLPEPGCVILANEDLVKGIVRSGGGIYEYAVGPMPQSYGEVEKLVRFGNREEEVRYELQNSVTFELEGVHEILVVLADVFLYIGLGFAVFASFLLANFIGTSIAYKKQQIGILRAIGARSNDVFRIFFSESFLIAMINFLLAAMGTAGAVALINFLIRNETGILITVLVFSLRQVLLIFGASLLVAAVASFIPVKKIASKKPIDAIRDR